MRHQKCADVEVQDGTIKQWKMFTYNLWQRRNGVRPRCYMKAVLIAKMNTGVACAGWVTMVTTSLHLTKTSHLCEDSSWVGVLLWTGCGSARLQSQQAPSLVWLCCHGAADCVYKVIGLSIYILQLLHLQTKFPFSGVSICTSCVSTCLPHAKNIHIHLEMLSTDPSSPVTLIRTKWQVTENGWMERKH